MLQDLKDFSIEFPFLFYSILIFILFAIFGFFDIYQGETKEFSGVVIDRFHQLEHTSHGYGTVNSSRGGVSTIQTTDHTPEKYVVMVRADNGEVIKITTNATNFYNDTVNKRVDCYRRIGHYSGIVWSNNIKREIKWNE